MGGGRGIPALSLLSPRFSEPPPPHELLVGFVSSVDGVGTCRRGVKWDNPPLWPVAVPSIAGFALACSPLRSYKIDALSFLSTKEGQDSLLAPLICLLLLSLLLKFSPPEVGNSHELTAGAVAALLFGVLPQVIFFPWMVVVILLWLSQSIYLWKYDFPPFRIGIWMGLGASSGLYLGGFFAHYFL